MALWAAACSPAATTSLKERILQLARQVTARQAAVEALVRDARRGGERLRMADAARIPESSEASALALELNQLAESLRATLKSFQVSLRESRRSLPPESPSFELADDDVRGVMEISFVLVGTTLAAAVPAVAGLRRLVVLKSARQSGNVLFLEAEAYWFFPDLRPPLPLGPLPPLAEALRAFGIPAGAGEDDPEVRAAIAKIREAYARLPPGEEGALEVVRRVAVARRRLQFLEQAVQAQRRVDPAALLRAE
jgi:hypothetical protein